MVIYEEKFRVPEGNASESVDSAIVKNALRFPNEDTRIKITFSVNCLYCSSPSISQSQNPSPVKTLANFHSSVQMTNHTTL